MSKPDTPANSRAIYPFIGILAVVLPIVIWQMRLPIVSNSYGPLHEPFELFCLFASAALGLIGYLEIRRRTHLGWLHLLPLLLFILVGFHYLILMNEFEGKSFDYTSYENAARMVIEGGNPYEAGAYLYPPLTAQAMALAYRLLEPIASGLPVTTGPGTAWFLVFYLYQCLQFGLILGAFVLCYRFVKRLGLGPPASSILVAAVLLIDNPLVRTLKHQQVNLWLLDLMLLAILFIENRQWLSGLCVAIAAHIKVYPAILVLPWIGMKRWKAVIASVAGAAAVVALQVVFGGSLDIYNQFASFAREFPASTAFRDNGIYSVMSNSMRVFGVDVSGSGSTVDVVVWLLTVAILAWFLVRFMRREKSYRTLTDEQAASNSLIDTLRVYGHFADSLAVMLLVSPMVWEHHYVLTVPVILWAFATRGLDRPWQIGAASFLILAVPTFDMFPFSYHRLAGLLMLVCFTPPELPVKGVLQTASNTSVPAPEI